eukprot:362582_1
MAISLLWCIMLTISITFTSSSSDSSDDSGGFNGGSDDANEIFEDGSKLFVGSYAVSLPAAGINGVVSVCEEDGIFYIAIKLVTESTDYIDTVGNATGGFTVTVDTITINFEGHKFLRETVGSIDASGKIEYNTETREYVGTVDNGIEMIMVTFDKISDEAEICLAPGGKLYKWTDFNTPFMAESADLSKDMCQAIVGIDNCAEIQRYESVTDDGGSCW